MSRQDGPTSVAIFGNSGGVLVAGERGEDLPLLTYPAALARARCEGLAFDVSNHCQIAAIVSDASGIWLDPLSKSRPDVVVLQYGAYEALPRLTPRWLTRYLMGIRRHSGRMHELYWHRAARTLRLLGLTSARVDALLPWQRGGYLSPKKFEDELRLICTRIHRQIACRVVLMDAYIPSTNHPTVTKRVVRRIGAINAAIERVANQLDLEVFPLASVVDELGGERVMGDGLHLNNAAHRRVGKELARFLAAGTTTRPT